MDAHQRRELERRAERAVRRGELREAVSLYGELSRAHPEDPHLRSRLQQVEATLEPGELAQARLPQHSEPSSVFATPQQEAEARAARGDFDGAIAGYRALLVQDPRAELIEERLLELSQLAAARRGAPAATRTQLLEHLLERIASRRR